MPEDIKEKIAFFCDVERRAVIPLMTVETVYEVPLILHEAGLGGLITEALGLSGRGSDLEEWRELVWRIRAPKQPFSVAVVGKYADLPDAYISVKEALRHAGLYYNMDVDIRWIPSEELEHQGSDLLLQHVCGIVVPGGFGTRGVEGMILAAQYARERRVPYLGLCLGMQLMVVEMARHCAGLAAAHSREFDPETPDPVIDLMPEQHSVKEMGGTMRLGIYPCSLLEGSRARRAYDVDKVWERHRHRFELNNAYRETLEEAGLLFSGISPDGQLVEIAEVVDHPFMVGMQFHPEFLSRPNRPHPLFRAFVDAARDVVREGGQPPLPLGAGGPRA